MVKILYSSYLYEMIGDNLLNFAHQKEYCFREPSDNKSWIIFWNLLCIVKIPNVNQKLNLPFIYSLKYKQKPNLNVHDTENLVLFTNFNVQFIL